MIKHTETIYNTTVRRQDTTWKYEWDVDNPDKEGTIFLSPIIYDKKHEKTWTFAPDEETGANPYTLNIGDDLDGNPKNRLDGTWYGKFSGQTRYLKPYSSLVTVTSEVGNVTVDPFPPKFITDDETDNVIFSPVYNVEDGEDDEKIYKIAEDSVRHFEFQFQDKSGLDFKHFCIKLDCAKEGQTSTENIVLYDYVRALKDNFYKEDCNYEGTYFPDTYENSSIPVEQQFDPQERWIKNVKVKYDGANLYSISFDLVSSHEAINGEKKLRRFFASPRELLKLGYNWNTSLDDVVFVGNSNEEYVNVNKAIFLNQIPTGVNTIGDWILYLEGGKDNDGFPHEPHRAIGRLILEVYDLAGNKSIYYNKKELWTIDTDDIDNIVPVNITYFNPEPSNYFVNDNIEGKISVNAQDMNKFLWRFPVEAELTGISIGQIDTSTYPPFPDGIEWKDNSKLIGCYNVLTGCRGFNVFKFTQYGYVEVAAWVETGNKKIDAIIKERTYNTAKNGPWIYEDEGRKYNLLRFVPSYLRNTDFNDFIEFFQLFINTMYLSLDKNRNISVLEKIARIGNFNDIDKIETKLLMHYENQYANEFPFDKKAIQEVNTLFSNVGWEVKDDEEVYGVIKYVLDNLPGYNRYKGSNLGVAGALKMFGFTCKVINLWIHKKNTIEEDPNFVEEDRLSKFGDFFQTSRFNIEVDSNNYFETFNEHLDFFINLVKSIKPITKILDMIKYTVSKQNEIAFIHDNNVSDKKESLVYVLSWAFDADESLKDKIVLTSNVDYKTRQCSSLCFPYKTQGLIDIQKQTLQSSSKIYAYNYDSKKYEEKQGYALDNYYTIIGKLMECNKTDIIFRCYKKGKRNRDGNIVQDEIYYRIPFEKTKVTLNPGMFCLSTENGTGLINLFNMFTSYINNYNLSSNDEYDYHKNAILIEERAFTDIEMAIEYIPGTNYIQCLDDKRFGKGKEIEPFYSKTTS